MVLAMSLNILAISDVATSSNNLATNCNVFK